LKKQLLLFLITAKAAIFILKPAVLLMRFVNCHDVSHFNNLFRLVDSVEYRKTSTHMHPEKVIIRKLQLLLVISSMIWILFQNLKLSFNQPFTLFGE